MGIMLYKVVLTFESMGEILKDSRQSYWAIRSCGSVCYAAWGRSSISVCGSNPKVKATKQYFSVAMHIMLYKVVLTFEPVDEILKYDQSNVSYWAMLSCGAVYYAVKGGSNCWVCEWNPKVWPFQSELPSSTFLWCCSWTLYCTRCFLASQQYFPLMLFIMLYMVVLTFESVRGWHPKVWPLKWKLLSSTFSWYCLLCSTLSWF